MNGPKFRFTVVVSFLLICFWAYRLLENYLFGERGLNFERYGHGVLVIGGSALAGFALVWTAAKLMDWARHRKTGFEADVTDEYGTQFKMRGSDGNPESFKLSLSKFLPQVFAAPTWWPGVHPLEAELMGFLNGFRHWPYDLDKQDRSLYDHAMAQWEAMRQLPGAQAIHRIAALAQDLGKVYAYKEVRTHYPWHEFWRRDRVRFERRCREHGGLAGFVLSTLHGFRTLGFDAPNPTEENRRLRRALLTAMKHRHDPMSLPVNSDPLARETVDFLHRAAAKARELYGQTAAHIEPTPEALADVERQLKEYLPALSDDLVVTTDPSQPDTEAVYFGNGRLAVRHDVLMSRLAQLLSPTQREMLQLWESGGGINHPAWHHLQKAMTNAHLLVDRWDDVPAAQGVFTLRLGSHVFGPVGVVTFSPERFPGVVTRLDSGPIWTDPVDVMVDPQTLMEQLAFKAGQLDVRLATIQ